MMYLGRFLSILSLDEIFAQSLFGRNLRRHQPFNYCEDSTLANDDPRDVKDQSIQNVLAHWIPKFMIDSMYELVTDNNGQKLGESNIHTLTRKQPDNIIAPTIARHLENYHHIKSRPTDDHGQNTFAQYIHFIEQEMQNDELRDLLGIYKHPLDKEYYDKFENHFKLALQTSPFVIKERIERSSKYTEQNMAMKYARKNNHSFIEFTRLIALH